MLFEGTWREMRQMAKRAAFWVLLITEDRQVGENDWPQNGGDIII